MKKIIIADHLWQGLGKENSIFSRSGFKIFRAVTGEDVFRIHQSEKADLIIADLAMPGLAGDQLCSKIRKDDSLKDVSIIIVHSGKPSDREKCQDCGANLLIEEPVNTEELSGSATQLLHIPQRKDMRILLKVSVKGGIKDRFFFSLSHDISTSGILFETDTIISEGDHITCSFFINSLQVITHGEVVRTVKKGENLYQYGIKFTDMNPVSKATIEEFVRKQRHL